MPKRSGKKNKVAKKRKTAAQPKPRPSRTWLGLALLPILIVGVWKTLSGPPATESGELPAERDTPSVAKTDEPPRGTNPNDGVPTGDLQQGDVQTDHVSVQAPGAMQQSYVAPLADAYRRIDPSADGWQTEAFNEASSQQLKQLAKLFEGNLDAAILDALTNDAFTCPPLQPASLHDVFEDKTLRVQRATSLDTAADNVGTVRGPAALRAAIEKFRQLYSSGEIERVKLKPFRIAAESDVATTTIYFQSVGACDAGRLQVNAKWNVDWSVTADKPKLQAIKVEEYETVLHRDVGQRMFADCTASVLGDTDAYKNQFLRSTDYWRARLPRELGLDPVGNHGLAIGDVNGDQLEDLYVCQQGGLPNRLFLQNADGTLRDVSENSGANWLDYCASALLVDFDNDGDRDLVIAQEWRILLMANDGQGRFELEFGRSSHAQSFSLSAADYDLDGDVDVFVCGYNPNSSTLRRGAMGEPVPYHDANNGGRNMLLRNDGNWLFTDVTSDVGLDENNSRFSFAAAWEDYDNDGDPDLYVANDYGQEQSLSKQRGQVC